MLAEESGSRRKRRRRRRRRSDDRDRLGFASLLPQLLTTANLAAGFFAIVKASSGDVLIASYAVFIAAVFDILDRNDPVTRTGEFRNPHLPNGAWEVNICPDGVPQASNQAPGLAISEVGVPKAIWSR